MENNQMPPNQSSNTQVDPVVPVADNTNTAGDPPVNTGTKSNKGFVWMVIAIVVILVLAALTYWYMSSQGQQTGKSPGTTQKADIFSDLNTELNSLTDENVDTDFVAVDQDLQSL